MKKELPQFSNEEIRQLILQYFYDRSNTATSLRGKKGSAVKMKDIKSELKKRHNFSDAQIVNNLSYLLSQNWVQEQIEKKSFTTPGGVAVPSEVHYYSITAAGTDKIEGPGKFTPKRFDGINIKATGSVVTIGDGNQINVKFTDAAQALSELRKGITKSNLTDEEKLDAVTDIDSMQDQLAKASPNKNVLKLLWSNVEKIASVGAIADLAAKTVPYILPLLP